MGHNSQALSAATAASEPQASLRFGPLGYTLFAHDSWGARMLANLTRILPSVEKPQEATRTIHLHRQSFKKSPDNLPAELGQFASQQEGSWQPLHNRVGQTWHHPATTEAFWTDGAHPELGNFSFQLPWNLIIADIAALGGGLMHGGLAAYRGNGVFFLAPPGGGKTTTLATAPDDWTVLSDDAALVWPQRDAWLSSPLPSWTRMTAANSANDCFDATPRQAVSALIILAKGMKLQLTTISARAAAAAVYRGLTEYPATVFADLPLTEHFFRTACTMARALPCYRLELPLGGDCWPLLTKALTNRP